MVTYIADFETTCQKNYQNDGFVRVWAWQVCDIFTIKPVAKGTSIESFIKFCSQKSSIIYFHNLAFDGEFIVDYLTKNNWKWAEKAENKKEFSTLITDSSIWYKIEIIHSGKGKHKIKTEFRDSHKKLPMSVSEIAKAFKLEITKGEIDYEKYRPKNYKPTNEEWEYIENDTKIVAFALREQILQGLDELTIGADCMKKFKETLKPKAFKYLFPCLGHALDSELRTAYRGGWCFLNPKYKGIILNNVKSLDVNSLYPYVMTQYPYPYGFPQYFKGKYKRDEKYPLYIQRCYVLMKLKSDGFPFIQLKNSFRFGESEYITDTGDEPIPLTLTALDLEILYENYEIYEIKFLYGWKFKQISGIFTPYFVEWYNKKVTDKIENNSGLYIIDKLMCNNLGGKFAARRASRLQKPLIDNNTLNYSLLEPEQNNTGYLPVAIFMTSYARAITIRAASSLGNDFIYSDTDSIHTFEKTDLKAFDIDDYRLGAWKDEGTASRAVFIHPKAYIREYSPYECVATVSGASEGVRKQMTIDNFFYGNTFSGNLRKKRVKGGCLLVDEKFTINF